MAGESGKQAISLEGSLTKVEPVYVEVSALLSKNLTGIGRLVARMIEALARRRPVRLVTTVQKNQARSLGLSTALLCGQEIRLEDRELPSADGDVASWTRDLLRRAHCRHDAEAASRHAGIYPVLRPAERHFRREICYLHDFTPALLPWTHLPGTCEHFGIFFSYTGGFCDGAVANSRSTKNDARWLFALPDDRVVVGHPGPSLCVREHACRAVVRRQGNVILTVATMEPRKNGRFLLDWFLNTTVLPTNMELWWVGPKGWLTDRCPALPRSQGGRHLRFFGMISDRRLCQLYRQAAFTVYPSLYEGFGFPVLDSLCHGTPVLCAYNSSLQEFAGPGVFYFDAYDSYSLDEAYLQFGAEEHALIPQEERRKRFSWDGLADAMLKLCA
jgi:glycosyltransferase involved in cell wall biosynthesis